MWLTLAPELLAQTPENLGSDSLSSGPTILPLETDGILKNWLTEHEQLSQENLSAAELEPEP